MCLRDGLGVRSAWAPTVPAEDLSWVSSTHKSQLTVSSSSHVAGFHGHLHSLDRRVHTHIHTNTQKIFISLSLLLAQALAWWQASFGEVSHSSFKTFKGAWQFFTGQHTLYIINQRPLQRNFVSNKCNDTEHSLRYHFYKFTLDFFFYCSGLSVKYANLYQDYDPQSTENLKKTNVLE